MALVRLELAQLASNDNVPVANISGECLTTVCKRRHNIANTQDIGGDD